MKDVSRVRTAALHLDMTWSQSQMAWEHSWTEASERR